MHQQVLSTRCLIVLTNVNLQIYSKAQVARHQMSVADRGFPKVGRGFIDNWYLLI